MAGEIAYFLRHRLGLQRGDRVGIISPNSTLYCPVVLGILRAGLTCVTLNPIYSSEELLHPLSDSDVKALFVHPVALPTVQKAFSTLKLSKTLPNGQNRIWIMDDVDWSNPQPTGERDFRPVLEAKELPVETVSPTEDLAFIVYSSGTSGKPKGVMLTHDNLIAGTDTFMLVNEGEFGPGHTAVGVLPFFHIFGLNFYTMTTFLIGVHVVVVPRFDINVFCAVVQRFRCSIAMVVPPMVLALARHPVVDKYDMSTLRVCLCGAAPLGPELCDEVQRRLPNVSMAQGYGLSETSPVLLRAPAKVHRKHPGMAGRIVPHIELRLVAEDGRDVGFEQGHNGQPGEVWARGRPIMKGYLNNPEATADCMTPDGWFKTGDVAIVKDGNFYIVDRTKELIKYKGFQVSPAELEDHLLGNPNVADCAVVGLYDKGQATELPRAYVVPTASKFNLKSSSPSEKEAFAKSIADWLNNQVANHKKLRGGVELIDAIPKSASGKILRRFLRDRANGK